ncbi:hypothetical protein IH86_01490 [Sphingobium yanoikuyae]|nr:hypothetical protein IH86_01490 [Sphingobium yanoikuyae]
MAGWRVPATIHDQACAVGFRIWKEEGIKRTKRILDSKAQICSQGLLAGLVFPCFPDVLPSQHDAENRRITASTIIVRHQTDLSPNGEGVDFAFPTTLAAML